MLQQMLQSLLKFLTEFVATYPRISYSIFGVLCALGLIAFVVAINLIGGGNH